MKNFEVATLDEIIRSLKMPEGLAVIVVVVCEKLTQF